MSEISIDGGVESKFFMSLPGTPVYDDDFVWKGELVHGYLVLGQLISVTAPSPRFFPRIKSCFRRARAFYTPRSGKW